jgi:hypothetical protein
MPFGHEDADRSVIRIDYLAVADLVLDPAECMSADGIAAYAPFRRQFGELGFRNQIAGGGFRSRERDTRGLADQAASPVAPY